MKNKAAIVIIDMQVDFFATEYEDPRDGARVRKGLSGKINQLLDAAEKAVSRSFSRNTVLSADTSDWNLRFRDIGAAICIEGTPGAELVPEIKNGSR